MRKSTVHVTKQTKDQNDNNKTNKQTKQNKNNNNKTGGGGGVSRFSLFLFFNKYILVVMMVITVDWEREMGGQPIAYIQCKETRWAINRLVVRGISGRFKNLAPRHQ